jgi:hypothetical protein
MSESKRRTPFTREAVAANIANCRACWTPDTQAIMSEDATSGQLERRGITTSDDKLKKPRPLAAYTEVGKQRHPTFFVEKSECAGSVEAERHTHTEQQRYGIW